MKITKSQLQEMIATSVAKKLSESGSPTDYQLIQAASPQFEEAMKMLKVGMEKYKSAMMELSKANHEKVKEIGVSGVQTADTFLRHFSKLEDDLYVAEWQLNYDNEQDMLAAAEDEYGNRNTLGEPKV